MYKFTTMRLSNNLFTISLIFFYLIGISNTQANVCEKSFWENTLRDKIYDFLSESNQDIYDPLRSLDVLYDMCENGQMSIDIAYETLGNSIIDYLFCRATYEAIIVASEQYSESETQLYFLLDMLPRISSECRGYYSSN